MRAIILGGGLGTRLSEETEFRPKPMVLIGDKPILWHIMKIYASFGVQDFVIATGYKHQIIEEWVDQLSESWNVECLFTGEQTQTGGRIRQCIDAFNDDSFFVTYGDGLANVNIDQLIKFHETHGVLATVTAVHPPARFGVLDLEGDKVIGFSEKDRDSLGWINGGFFVLNREIRELIHSDSEPFEVGALPRLTNENQLRAFKHTGFWQPMDTLREKNELDELARRTVVPWFQFD